MYKRQSTMSSFQELYVKSIADIWAFIKRNIPTIVLTYILWTVLHFVAAHLYIHFCIGNTLWGFITSPLYTSAPHCQALSWGLWTLSRKFLEMWPLLGSFLLSKFLLTEE